MQHFYKNIDSENWFNYEELYLSMVDKFNSGSHFVEVGTWKGMSACFMAVEIINSGKQIKFDCVDNWEFLETFSDIPENLYTGLYDTFLKNIEPVKDTINIVRQVSWEAASTYPDESLDFVFIDAGHDYASVAKDLIAWLPKVKKTGILSGHDYQHDPIRNALRDIIGEVSVTCGNCWIYTK